MLETPWLGLRPDVILHPGPVDPDGQRSWLLEDPVRGNNFRLGYTEGELLYRLATTQNPDAALRNLYTTTTLRPSLEEVASFVTMLQRERLAILPRETVIQEETEQQGMPPQLSLIQKLLQGSIFFRIPLLRPDAFLTRTLPYVSWLWSPFACGFYLLCGLVGLVRTLQEIELYFSAVDYLFTPQGGLAFVLCLALLKIGHEFAHAYATKSLASDLHVRSMGIFFIVFWPLLYTDTTDVWKIPDRRRRMWVSAAGVLFELAIAGIALLLWSLLPDGIPRSLMFFLSGTSLVTSVFVNLNPFMRFDGYYLLMDYWGIDNLRPRAFAMLRHTVRRILLDWKGPAPEVHPHRRGMILYGFLAMLYRLFISISIAVAVYYLFFPILAIAVLCVELWLFIMRPLWMEIQRIVKNRRHMGSSHRMALSAVIFLLMCILLCVPLPQYKRLPCLVLNKGTARVASPAPGQLALPLPEVGRAVAEGDLITRISSDALIHEAQNVRFDIKAVKASIEGMGSGGEQGAYRNWLLAEQKRLAAASEKMNQVIAQLEIRAPADGQISDVNEDIYEKAFVAKDTYLFTISDPDSHELKVFVHEHLAGKVNADTVGNTETSQTHARFPSPELPPLAANFRKKDLFPISYLPNEALLDIAGGPIISVQDARGKRPRDAHFTFTFDIPELPLWLPHGMPSRTWMRIRQESVMGRFLSGIWKNVMERGLF